MKKILFILAILLFSPVGPAHASTGLLVSCAGMTICDSGLHCSSNVVGADAMTFDKGKLCLPEPDYPTCGPLGNCSNNTDGNKYCATVQAVDDNSKYGVACLNALEAPQDSAAISNCAKSSDCTQKGYQCVLIAGWTTNGLNQFTGVKRCIDLNKLPPPVVDTSLIPAAAPGQSGSHTPPAVPGQTFSQFAPQLEITIPGLQFQSQITAQPMAGSDMRVFSVPYLASYINAVYKYAIGVGVIIAVLMIMFAGFKWMSSFGNAKAAGEAKHMIGNAILGLSMLFSVYTILYIINPNLVNLNAINILAPKQEVFSLEDLTFTDEDHTDQGTDDNVTSSPSQYDSIFQSYAMCSGINWQLMKAVAQHESGLNASIHNPNSSAVGLFQAMAGKDNKTCKNVLKSVNLDGKCDDPSLTDPALNTAYATLIFKTSVGKINNLCSGASTQDKVFLMYFAHSSGPGAMGAGVKQYGCNPYSNAAAWPDAGTLWPDGTALGLAGRKVYNGATKTYINKIVDKVTSLGVNNFSGPKDASTCPLNK